MTRMQRLAHGVGGRRRKGEEMETAALLGLGVFMKK